MYVTQRQAVILDIPFKNLNFHNSTCTVEPLYNEALGTMKITLLYQVSCYIRVKKQRNIKSWDQQNDLVIRGFCYIWPLYNEVLLYCLWRRNLTGICAITYRLLLMHVMQAINVIPFKNLVWTRVPTTGDGTRVFC